MKTTKISAADCVENMEDISFHVDDWLIFEKKEI